MEFLEFIFIVICGKFMDYVVVLVIEVNGIRFKEIFSFGDFYFDIGNCDFKNFIRIFVGFVN